MFHIKICGVKLKSDIEATADASGDAIGLNFYPASVRYVDPSSDATRELSDHAARRGLTRVGVFVNESSDTILEIVGTIGLDVIQLHGDETISEAASILDCGKPVLRAIKLSTGPLLETEIQSQVEPWLDAGAGVLLDADAGVAHGGSGKTLDWASIRKWSERHPEIDWVLAGGLHPENVAEAIRTSGARRVDTASGVEQPRGVKSAERIATFCRSALQGFSK